MTSVDMDENSQSQDGLQDVISARSRLSGALSTAERIVDKYAGDDFPDSPIKRFQSLDSPFPSPAKSPRGVRRRRKKPLPLNTAFHHTFVMKLFDRSVDLAQFPDNTALYPVCRAWMKNDPHNTNMAPRLRTPTPEPENGANEDKDSNEDNDETETTNEPETTNKDPDVYKLPMPEPIMVVGEAEPRMSVRVPQIERPEVDRDFFVKDNPDAPDTSSLMVDHMARWQSVRQHWKEKASDNEKRYAESMTILTEMFEK